MQTIYKNITRAANLNYVLWKTAFWQAWEPLPLDQKATWIFFISNTLAVLTLIEMLMLKY